MKVYVTWNKHPRWVLHELITEISNELSSKYSAHLIKQEGGYVHIPELNYNLPDCEIVIYDEDNDILRAISYSENRTGLWDIFNNRNKNGDILICVHQNNWGLQNFNNDTVNFKFKKTNFYAYLPNFNYDEFYHKRNNISLEETIDKMFFRCTTGRGDEFELERLGFINERFKPVSLEKYCDKAIGYKVGLSIAGAAEICHRDIEYMAIGLPMIRMEYTQEYEPNLIPNYHYISVDRGHLPKDSNLDKRGGDVYIKKYIKRFEEIKNDYEFLKFISKNARKYYDDNCVSGIRLNNMLNKLEL